MNFFCGSYPCVFCIFGQNFVFFDLIGRFILRLRVVFLLLFFVGLASAQLLDMSQMSADYMAENKVHKVRVEGNQHMDERAVLSRIGIRDGQSYSPAACPKKSRGR